MKKSIIKYIVIFIVWIILSVRWFYGVKSPIIGAIWIIAGLIAFIIFIAREIKNDRDNYDDN